MPAVAPHGIDGLVRGNGVQPRAEGPARLILAALDVHLKEGVLKHVLGKAPILEITPQVTVEFALVPSNQEPKRFGLSSTKAVEQILIRTDG
jgi:hypothetical protein